MRKQGFMSSGVFEKVLLECSRYGTAIRFVRWGEPLLHPWLLVFVRMVKSKGLLCHINTNGYFCDDQFISEIIKIPLDSIKFSFQGTDRQTYKEWRGKDIFVYLEKMLAHLYAKRKTYPYIQIGTTVTDDSDKKIAQFKERMGKICDEVTVGKTRNIIAGEEKGCNPECPEIFDKLSINWDGSVSACCSDYDNFMIVGDVKKERLKDIWVGEKINYYRKMLLDQRWGELQLCRMCCP